MKTNCTLISALPERLKLGGRFLSFALGAALLAGGPLIPQAKAISITFEAMDLVDSVLGQDLWGYTYRLSDAAFRAGEGFSILFDYRLYQNLETSTSLPGWSILAVQPDLGLPDAGFYDAQAIEDLPSISGMHYVSFVWLGEGDPGAQEFLAYDSTFNTIGAGNTAPAPTAVPDLGGTGQLLSVALGSLLLLGGVRRRFQPA